MSFGLFPLDDAPAVLLVEELEQIFSNLEGGPLEGLVNFVPIARLNAVPVAGIGTPAQFFHMLRAAGFRVEATMAFPDHHRYSAADIARIDAEARRVGAQMVLTTDKDAVRFESLGTLPFTLTPVALQLDVVGWDALTASIDAAIRRARGLT
jgi:tetraacyldisaccharide 4'-kinase